MQMRILQYIVLRWQSWQSESWQSERHSTMDVFLLSVTNLGASYSEAPPELLLNRTRFAFVFARASK